MKELLQITTEVGDTQNNKFNSAESATVVFDTNREEASLRMETRRKEIPLNTSYKYLGVYLDKDACTSRSRREYEKRKRP